ncbi:hypothetical protein L9F63_027117, partial [Diploptera punctata]
TIASIKKHHPVEPLLFLAWSHLLLHVVYIILAENNKAANHSMKMLSKRRTTLLFWIGSHNRPGGPWIFEIQYIYMIVYLCGCEASSRMVGQKRSIPQ